VIRGRILNRSALPAYILAEDYSSKASDFPVKRSYQTLLMVRVMFLWNWFRKCRRFL